MLTQRACFKRLEDYVRNDYVIVFFAGPMVHSPSFMWMIEAYKQLSREYHIHSDALVIAIRRM